MTNRFHPLKVSSIERSTSDCVLLTFNVPEALQTDFRFQQGQYLTLKTNIKGEEVRRSYSICSSPFDSQWRVAIKQVEEGKFSTFANQELKVGDTLEVMPPSGRFFIPTNPTATQQYVAFAAGSGITPILSIIKTHLQAEPNSRFKLFYVNRRTSSIILKEELEGLKNQFMDRFEIFHFLTQEQRSMPLFDGRIDAEKLAILSRTLFNPKAIDHYFLCGPEAMILTIRDFLTAADVEKSKIHFELFHSGVATKKKRRTIAPNAGQSTIKIQEGGKQFSFNIPKGSDNILDAALQHQADLPYACKGGVCCTCKAKLVKGDVEVLVNYGLEPEEIEQGYILTCQAIPQSEEIFVDFDGALATSI